MMDIFKKRHDQQLLRKGFILILLLIMGQLCHGQHLTRIVDINHDGKKDTIEHIAATNAFTLKYAANNMLIENEVFFFAGFGAGTANISFGTKKGLLWFSIRFAPKYIDQDTLWFSYNAQKKDWMLTKMTTYSFNTMDPKLISTTYRFRLKQKIWLLNGRYFEVQKLAEHKKNRIEERCTDKQEH